MAFTNAELTTAIQDYCQNSEATFVTHIPDFIRSTEDRVFGAVQMASSWKSSNHVTTNGKATYNAAVGSIDISSVRLNETASSSGAADKGPTRYLIRKDYDFLLEAYPGTTSASTNSVPKYYAVSSASASIDAGEAEVSIRLGPIPDAVYAFTVDYYGKAIADSLTGGAAGGTWLSNAFPQVLLDGCLAEAYVFMKGEPALIQGYESKFRDGLMTIKNLGEGRENDDAYTDGTKRVPTQ